MKNKLAVLIIGCQNSGKTTTINHFDKTYDSRGILKKYCRVGWRQLQLFKGKLDAILSAIYFIPSSPSERGKSLKKILGEKPPKLLLMAEQKDGKEYRNTIEFLNNNDYEIVEFYTKSNSSFVWKEWTCNNFEDIMEKRAVEIGDTFRKFIINRIK